jgi:hypothetical protein
LQVPIHARGDYYRRDFPEHGTREAAQIVDGVATRTRVPDSIGIANTAFDWDRTVA